jgi:pimeloyl-ACP methyl ester carboxylesterase
MMTTAKPLFEPAVGRYLRLDIAGRSHRLYVEEAGAGIPLLCLHTAGADGRQYRALMNDADVLARFRVIAFDLPWHGKSSPPAGWQNEEYRLTSRGYLDVIMAVTGALELDRPIVIGCSIGGRIVLHLALEHPQRFRALIGLESAAHADPYYDLSWLHRPDVHGGEVCGAVISGLIAPTAPEADRWETIWHYMQGGPGVFKGDLYFYTADGDVRGRMADIDTGKCPLYLLTGEYDYSCTPDDTRELARRIPGAQLTIMTGLGHFPVSEDPGKFLTYLRPLLRDIAAVSDACTGGR